MQAPLQKKIEIKVYILYVMKNIGYPVEFSRLNDTVTADEPVNSFSFIECFSELLDTGNVERIDINGTDHFLITEQGINVADNLLYMLIPSVQKIALGAATRLVSFDKRGAATEVKILQEQTGYRFIFSIIENNKKIFSVEYYTDNGEQAKQMKNNIERDPEGTYKTMLAVLNGQQNYLFS